MSSAFEFTLLTLSAVYLYLGLLIFLAVFVEASGSAVFRATWKFSQTESFQIALKQGLNMGFIKSCLELIVMVHTRTTPYVIEQKH